MQVLHLYSVGEPSWSGLPLWLTPHQTFPNGGALMGEDDGKRQRQDQKRPYLTKRSHISWGTRNLALPVECSRLAARKTFPMRKTRLCRRTGWGWTGKTCFFWHRTWYSMLWVSSLTDLTFRSFSPIKKKKHSMLNYWLLHHGLSRFPRGNTFIWGIFSPSVIA